MSTPIRTELDETTVKALDGWRAQRKPSLSRADAIETLLRERLRVPEPQPSIPERLPAQRLPDESTLAALYALNRVSGFGPVKFRLMHEAGVDPREALKHPEALPLTGRMGSKLKHAVEALPRGELDAARARADRQLHLAKRHKASILVHGDTRYPKRVYDSNNPVPILFVRGDPAVWNERPSVAVVGSRQIREPYATSANRFATAAASAGTVVVSGFAMGADSIAHRAARAANGATVCVMPCGLDKVFPPENRELWEDLLGHPRAVFVSEFGFGQRTSALLLRKRNKLIVAFSQGVLVAQSAAKGGAMNAYRFAREQRKPVATFEPDTAEDTMGNRVIQQDTRTGGLAFELNPGSQNHRRWLRQLCSSI